MFELPFNSIDNVRITFQLQGVAFECAVCAAKTMSQQNFSLTKLIISDNFSLKDFLRHRRLNAQFVWATMFNFGDPKKINFNYLGTRWNVLEWRKFSLLCIGSARDDLSSRTQTIENVRLKANVQFNVIKKCFYQLRRHGLFFPYGWTVLEMLIWVELHWNGCCPFELGWFARPDLWWRSIWGIHATSWILMSLFQILVAIISVQGTT